MLVFRTLVDALFWGLILQVFFYTLGLASAFTFGTRIFTLPAFVLWWFYAFLIIYVLRLPSTWETKDADETKN